MTTARATRRQHEAATREAARRMNPEVYAALRDAYYKAAEGLAALEFELQQAALDDDYDNAGDDALCSDGCKALTAEMRHATDARKALAKSCLGAIL